MNSSFVFSFSTEIEATVFKDLLALEGIGTRLVQRYDRQALSWAELWLLDESQSEDAQAALAKLFDKDSSSNEIRCKSCLEWSPEKFILFWNCGESFQGPAI